MLVKLIFNNKKLLKIKYLISGWEDKHIFR